MREPVAVEPVKSSIGRYSNASLWPPRTTTRAGTHADEGKGKDLGGYLVLPAPCEVPEDSRHSLKEGRLAMPV